jgi:hypothetical protein
MTGVSLRAYARMRGCSLTAVLKAIASKRIATLADGSTLLRLLTGGTELKQRVQHPKVYERTDRGTSYWFFRYYHDEIQPDGSIKTSRRFHTVGPSRGKEAISHKDACRRRDEFLSDLNAAATKPGAVVAAREPEKAPEPGDISSSVSSRSCGAMITSITRKLGWRCRRASSTTIGSIATSCRDGRTRAWPT